MDTWNFQTNKDGSGVGWNDPALQTFRVGRVKNLAREIIQNSTDHQVDPKKPVRIVFGLSTYPRNEIPGIDSLARAIKGCEKIMSTENENSKNEIKAAARASNVSNLKVLTIADYGASGMGDTFHTYLKTSGQSDGNNSDRGGSHGLGKSAPILLSSLRSIVVSSIWKDKNGRYNEAIQGRTTLMARKIDGSEETYNNVGYWGDGFSSILSSDHSYPWINRPTNNIGTSIHVVGFQPKKSATWKQELIAFSIASYFPAFYRGDLILEVRDNDISEFTVDQDNIEVFLEKNWKEILEQKEDQQLLNNAKHYYQLLKASDDQIIIEEFEIQNLGKCRLRLKVSESETEELPRKICILRKSISITDSLSTFYKQVPTSLMDFVGVFECLDKDGAAMIRRMEPPQHNDVHEEQLPISEQEKGRKILKDLGSILKAIVKKHATPDDDDETQLDALSEFLQDEADTGKADLETDPNGNWGVPSPKPLPKPRKKPALSPEGGEDQTGPDRTGKPKGIKPNPVPGPGPVSGTTTAAKTVDKAIKLSELRVVSSSVKALKILFKSGKTQNNCELSLLEMGSETPELMGITACDTGTCVKGKVLLDVEAGERIELNIEIERPLLGAMGLVLSHKISFEESDS